MTVRSVVAKLLENRQKALVFSQFVDYLAIIRAVLDESGAIEQYLASSEADSEDAVLRSQSSILSLPAITATLAFSSLFTSFWDTTIR